ncbi:hypothetical protein [Nitrosomonas sp. Is37]|nr:hypothetical protein [Nitrosomonas sp. Is37]MDV6344305.1 hypothetical protein [Nitrosomonas sp. Is37]
MPVASSPLGAAAPGVQPISRLQHIPVVTKVMLEGCGTSLMRSDV